MECIQLADGPKPCPNCKGDQEAKQIQDYLLLAFPRVKRG